VVEAANAASRAALEQMGLPMLDWAGLSPDEESACSTTFDGVHVHEWVDNLRAEMLFAMLCDDDFNFRVPGSITAGFWEDRYCATPYQRWWKPDGMWDHNSEGLTTNGNGEQLTPWPKDWCATAGPNPGPPTCP
jgi:hypothetical protein